jgi:hypothetical protein
VGRGRKRIVRRDPEAARAIDLQEDAMIEILASGGAPLASYVAGKTLIADGGYVLI